MQYKAVAFAALIIAAPAAAWDDPQSNTSAAKPKAQEKTYCLQFGLDTVSRINRTECKTTSEWAQLGVDVEELLAR